MNLTINAASTLHNNKIFSCSQLQHGLFDTYENFGSIQKLLLALQNGQIPTECLGCPSLQEIEYERNSYLFSDINLSHFTQCNLDCNYCMSNSNTAFRIVDAKDAPTLVGFFKKLLDDGYLDPHAIVRFGGGEPTLLPEFTDLVRFFSNCGARIWMQTNAVKFSPAIVECKDSITDLVISQDSATHETFKLIKGSGSSKRTWLNVEQYAKDCPDQLMLKFIILDGNFHEVRDFVARASELNVRRIACDIDHNKVIANQETLDEAKVVGVEGNFPRVNWVENGGWD